MVGQDTNIMWGVLSNSGVGSGAVLTLGMGVGVGEKVLWVTGGMQTSCSRV